MRGIRRNVWLAVLGAVILTTPHCVTDNNIGALKDLAASTAGSLVEILVAGRLESTTVSDAPNTDAPISSQHH